jgi:hypothetical protein
MIIIVLTRCRSQGQKSERESLSLSCFFLSTTSLQTTDVRTQIYWLEIECVCACP